MDIMRAHLPAGLESKIAALAQSSMDKVGFFDPWPVALLK